MTTPDKEEMPTDMTAGPLATSLSQMIIEWVDSARGRDWRGGLTNIIQRRLDRFQSPSCNAYEPMRKALEKVMVGGNHLGLIIGADHPPHTANHEEARAHYGDAIWTYEAWCCWKTIMEARPALSTLPVIDRQTSDDVGRLREALEATTAEIERDLNDYLSSVCVVRDEGPDRSTLDPEDAEEVARLECIIWRARAALSTFPVNDRHHSGSDNERMFENVRDAWKIVWEREAQIAQLSAALQGYIDNCTNEECEYCNKARAALKGVPQPATPKEAAMTEAQITKNKELIDDEIASLRAQLDEAKCKIEELGTHCALHESLAHGYTDEIAELQCRVDEARRKAIEDAAKTAEAFAKNHGVQWGDRKRFELHDIQRAVNGACGLIAEDIRALLSESKT